MILILSVVDHRASRPIIYTYHGGMTAVIWTDVIQLVVYLDWRGDRGGGPAARLIPGGWGEVRGGRRRRPASSVCSISRLSLTKSYTFWSGVDRRRVPHDGDARDRPADGAAILLRDRSARRARRSSGAARSCSRSSCCFSSSATMLFVYYTQHAPGDIAAFTQNGRLQTDRIFPYFIVQHLPPGVVGLVLAAIFAAAMSTLSSSLNSSSAAAVNDFYVPATGGRPRAHALPERIARADGVLRYRADRRRDRGDFHLEPRGGRSPRDRVVHERRHPRRVLPRHVHAPRRSARARSRGSRRRRS